MRRLRQPSVSSLVLGLACIATLVVGQSSDWQPGLRLPLALLAFLVVPGWALVQALRLDGDGLTTAALVLGLSIAVDLLGAELLVVLHVASVTNLLLSQGGVTVVCLIACLPTAVRARRGAL